MNTTSNNIKNTILAWLMAISIGSYWQEITKTLENNPTLNKTEQTAEVIENIENKIESTLSDSTDTTKQSPRYGRVSINSAPYISISWSVLNEKPFVAIAGGRSKNWFYAELEKWYNPESYKENGNYILPVVWYSKTFGEDNQRNVHPQIIGFSTQIGSLRDKESTLMLPNIRISYMPENRKITGRYTYAINPFNNEWDDHIAQLNISKPTKDITAGVNIRYNNGVFATDPTVSTGIEITHNKPIEIGKHIKANISLIGNLNISQKLNPEINTATKNVFAITTTWNIK